uniref:Zinc finger RING-H2-type domain-containing protein n=1 Tax=Catagonus wagneri TaxID=51154 RepID=A0A8C3VUR1_9CETA
MAAAMDVDTLSDTHDSTDKKHFEVRNRNGVALWAWDVVANNSAICRNCTMDLSTEYGANQAPATSEESVGAREACDHAFHLHCISSWLKHGRCVHWTTESGHSKSKDTRKRILPSASIVWLFI